ncbi:MAG: hypothetical protein HQL02_00245 [Nitrospirae bacterium]|nr:hypothetical protein [Nitrospirota bacterium]
MEIPDIKSVAKETLQVTTPKYNKTMTKPTSEAEAPAPQAKSTDVSKVATVQLSVAAQARQLQQQGFTAEQIASKLGISVETVNGYLGSEANTATTTTQSNS